MMYSLNSQVKIIYEDHVVDPMDFAVKSEKTLFEKYQDVVVKYAEKQTRVKKLQKSLSNAIRTRDRTKKRLTVLNVNRLVTFKVLLLRIRKWIKTSCSQPKTVRKKHA